MRPDTASFLFRERGVEIFLKNVPDSWCVFGASNTRAGLAGREAAGLIPIQPAFSIGLWLAETRSF